MDARVKVTSKNEKMVEDTIHNFVGEKAKYGQRSADWKKAKKETMVN